MALNPSIILSGQQFDLGRAMTDGLNLAAGQKQFDTQNALAELYKTQGAGLVAGDQGAINALAQFDPQAALGIKSEQQQMTFRAEDQQRQRDEARMNAEKALQEQAATLTADQLASEHEALSSALAGAATHYRSGNKAAYNEFLTSKGIDPNEWPFEDFEANAPTVEGVIDAIVAAQKAFAPPEGPEWRAATPEEAAANGAVAGQVNTKTGKFDAQNPPSGMVIETTPGGGTVVRQGPGVGAKDDGKMKPADPAAMIATIDGILSDPALPYSTGLYSLLQNVPGTPMKRFQGRSKQLEGQAFLQAFESLKGAGQITEIEGAKATQAIGRLDTAQDAKDYAQALTELREVLALAAQRPVGWAETQATAAPPAAAAVPALSPEAMKWLEE